MSDDSPMNASSAGPTMKIEIQLSWEISSKINC